MSPPPGLAGRSPKIEVTGEGEFVPPGWLQSTMQRSLDIFASPVFWRAARQHSAAQPSPSICGVTAASESPATDKTKTIMRSLRIIRLAKPNTVFC